MATAKKEISINGVKTIDSEKVKNDFEEEPVQEEKLKDAQENTTISEDIEPIEDDIPVYLPTKVIQANNLPESYDTIYGTVKIKNETDFNLSEEDLTPDIEFTDKTNVVIFHTHTCEAYTQTEENQYVATRKL